VVDFAGVDQIVALAPADVEPVPVCTENLSSGVVVVKSAQDNA
jgi:hypothetical protein